MADHNSRFFAVGESVSTTNSSSHSKISLNPFKRHKKDSTNNSSKKSASKNVPTPNQISTPKQAVNAYQDYNRLKVEQQASDKRLAEIRQNKFDALQEKADAERGIQESRQNQAVARQKQVEADKGIQEGIQMQISGHQMQSQALGNMIEKLTLKVASFENVSGAEGARNTLNTIISQLKSFKQRHDGGENIDAEFEEFKKRLGLS